MNYQNLADVDGGCSCHKKIQIHLFFLIKCDIFIENPNIAKAFDALKTRPDGASTEGIQRVVQPNLIYQICGLLTQSEVANTSPVLT